MLAIVLANYCFKTSYLHFCASKWKIWQLAAHHEYNVLFIIVLGAATQQHFTRGGFAPSCLHFSAPFEVVQTHRPNPRSNVLPLYCWQERCPFSLFPPSPCSNYFFKKKNSSHLMKKGYALPKHQTHKDRPVVEIRNQSGLWCCISSFSYDSIHFIVHTLYILHLLLTSAPHCAVKLVLHASHSQC